MRKIIKNPRKGVSIFELMIALAAIMIIMIASISLLKTSVSVGIKSNACVEASNMVESIVECFEYSKTKEDFVNNLKYFGKCDKSESDENKYIIDCGSYTVEIAYLKLSELEDGIVVEQAKIEIEAFYSDGKNIYKEKIIYYKGL